MKDGAATLFISHDGFLKNGAVPRFLSFIYNRQFAVNGYYASQRNAGVKRQRATKNKTRDETIMRDQTVGEDRIKRTR